MTHVAASDETPSEGRVRDDLDAELPCGLQKSNSLVLNIQGEGRIFYFNGCDRVDGVRSTKSRS